MTTDKKQKG